ncbi:MAG TPA: hypothetical protein VFR81_23435 [Longimicrobium sp.]|nr:hypothetical protein [Longimicrobium sp.]
MMETFEGFGQEETVNTAPAFYECWECPWVCWPDRFPPPSDA